MCEMKTLPLDHLIKYVYPDFYCLDCLFVGENGVDPPTKQEDGTLVIPEPARLQLSAEQ